MLIFSDISQKVSYNLRKSISEKINKLPLNYYDKKTNGEVFGKYAEEAKGIQKAFKEIKKDVNEDSSFLDTKKDIERSKKKA